MTLHIDVETYSETDLKRSGLYAYTADPSFEILLLAYSLDGMAPEICDLTHDRLPNWLIKALTDPLIPKYAWNAAFERAALSAHLGTPMPADQWHCTMVQAAMMGLPMRLELAAKAMKMEEQKLTSGKPLIALFTKPCKPTATNNQRRRNLPSHFPERWEDFKLYCQQDVATEMAIHKKLDWFKPTPTERQMWILDQQINDRGILLDRNLVDQAIRIDRIHQDSMMDKSRLLTGIDNPKSVAQLKKWLASEGIELLSLTKVTTAEAAASTDSPVVQEALRLRTETSKSSVSKYLAMAACIGRDDRARGLLQYYGAGRTGRWAGRLIQVQNLPQNHLKSLNTAREIVRSGDYELLEMLYPSTSQVLSELVRTAFIPGPGRVLTAVDFSAIEARVIAWLAGETWRLDVFKTHGKIYEASAAAMYRIPIEEVDKAMRAKGKVAELALGFAGGVGALQAMGSARMGIADRDLQGIVSRWRAASPRIVKLWGNLEDCAIRAMEEGQQHYRIPGTNQKIYFTHLRGALFVKLPSGRQLAYQSAQLQGGALTYMGTDGKTKQWSRQRTYGGKITENLVQAIARDLLALALLRLDAAGFKIVMHVHDEAVLEAEPGELEIAIDVMSEAPDWATGLPLGADGWEKPYYQK